MPDKLVCSPRSLPEERIVAAADRAATVNPVNRPRAGRLMGLVRPDVDSRLALAYSTTRYWGAKGVHLTVGFMEQRPADLRRRIISHLNAWSKTANVKFVASSTDPDVRIAFEGGADGGYWSYVGTDVLSIPEDEPTMNLEAFTMRTSDSEFRRVVRHEAGHTLGFPHEHMRKAIVDRIDERKAIDYFRRTQGWTAAETRQQVLTPLSARTNPGTIADPRSVMCYQLPGAIMKDGKPVLGGKDINAVDFDFIATIYPKRR